jgi:hypothetical protein
MSALSFILLIVSESRPKYDDAILSAKFTFHSPPHHFGGMTFSAPCAMVLAVATVHTAYGSDVAQNVSIS